MNRTGAAPTLGDLVIPIRGRDDLPPVTVPRSALSWSLAQARAASAAYAAATDADTADRSHRPELLERLAWLALSRALDHANGLTAGDRRSLVHLELLERLSSARD